MIQIETRQNSAGFWYCNATINGYDLFFRGNDVQDAQQKMQSHLAGNYADIDFSNIEWLMPVPYTKVSDKIGKPPVKFKPYRIDKSPFA